ncbi:hypothetical protein BASA81_011321 [Batrachochytrium salamandrivorans]|nr:hypothetical protein BASA81_011321 [Batrachochytrium salamandrivorans]
MHVAVAMGTRLLHHHSKTKLDLFLASHTDCSITPTPHTAASNSLLAYAISQALRNLLPSRIQDEYRVNFSEDSSTNLDILGQGRFGTVRKCTELATERIRAVKTQYKKHAKRDPVTGEFYEIQAMQQLPKGGFELVKVFQTPLKLHLVCELLSGPNFFSFWDRNHAWNAIKNKREEAEMAHYMLKLCTTLNQCHVAGYSHNDVKFENFMFRNSDQLVLIDFGSARPLHGSRKLHDLLGSPSYASPEVIREARFTETSDSWSLGIMSYVMLTGNFPFSTDEEEEGEEEEGEDKPMRKEQDPYDVYFCPIEWRKISAEAQDFTRKLLKPLPQERMTTTQALLHPFMQRAIATEQSSLNPYSMY